MKEKLISEIQAKMAPQLSPEQTKELVRVLTFCLRNVELEKKES